MKPIIAFWALALFAPFLSFAQDVPPAFEQSRDVDPFAGQSQNQSGEEHDLFDPALRAPKIVRVQVEYVEIAQKDLTRLLMEDKPKSADATALRMKVQAMVDKSEAKMLETQIVVARSGEKSTTESIHETIYPTEYDPPALPSPAKDNDDKSEPAAPAVVIPPGHPTAFETRYVGSTLEIEPAIGEDHTLIDLRFVPELVWHTGNTIWQETKDRDGNIHKVSMPDFYKIRLQTAVTCISGQYNLAGTLTPHNEAGKPDFDRKVMVFVKADILSVIK